MRRGAGLFVCALLLAGCTDHERTYRKALEQYEALITEHRPVSDAKYDEVLKTLSEIPASDPIHAKAQALIDAITSARRPLPPRPLAVAGSTSSEPMEQKRTECAALAKAYGVSVDAGREEARVKLAACREELERLDAAQAHAEEPGSQVPVHLADGGVVETLKIECAQWRAQLTSPDVDRERVLKSLALNADKLKMLDTAPGPCAYDGR